MSFSATYLGSSGWLVEFGEVRVLIDPWLKGVLSFPQGPWLIEGRLQKELEPPEQLDLLVLTQGLADHSHIPSLELLPRSIPVIGSKSASKVVKRLGFESVTTLSPGDIKQICQLEIEATAGASVPNQENGYIISNEIGSIYLEPHGFFDSKISPRELDAVITPMVDLKLPMVGDFIQGARVLPKLISIFKPLTVLASTTGGDAKFSGLINSLTRVNATSEKLISEYENQIIFVQPKTGEKYRLKSRNV